MFAKFSKEYSELSPIVEGIEALRRAQVELAAAAEMAGAGGDPELKALAEEELRSLRERLPESGTAGQAVPAAEGCR